MAKEAWTDERLDDLNKKVDDGFARVDRKIDEGIRDLRIDMKEMQGQINQRLDRIQVALIAALATFCATLIGSCATLVGVALL